MEKTLIVSFVLHLLNNFLRVSAFPKTTTESFIIHYLEDRRIIPVRIELNTNAQTEHVTSIAGETLYDFNVRKVAYKDLNSSQCFITDIVEESIENDRRRLKNLENGVVRGFYLPTFIIHEELNNTHNFTQNFGIILAEFCKEYSISLVVKQTHRGKRDTSRDKGQFTHHSYGHYGHQSNNYAHYGHETYIKGTTDENGQIRDQQVNHQQIRSGTSHVYPRPAHRNDQQHSSGAGANTSPRSASTNGHKDLRTDSRTGANIPQTQYQTQHRMPSYQQTLGEGGRIPSIGGTGQFSLQSSQEGGYQLSLPLGLQAGNIYRGGVRSGGHYGVGGLQPHIRTEYHQYPDSTIPTGYQPYDQRQSLPLPPVASTSYPSTLRGVSDADMRKIPSPIQRGISAPAVPITGDRRVFPSTEIRTSEAQIPFTTGDQRQPGIDYESQQRRQIDHRTIPSSQITSTAEDHRILPHTRIHSPSSIPDTRLQINGHLLGTGMPIIHMPSGTVHSPSGIPSQISTKIPTSDISDRERGTGVSRGSQIHGTYPDSMPGQQYIPSISAPQQQYFQSPEIRQPTELRFNGDIQRRPRPSLLIPGTYPSYPSSVDAGKQVSIPGSPVIPSIPHATLPVSHETIRNGVRYPDATRPQTAIKDVYPSGDTYPGSSRIPIDTESTSISRMRPGGIPISPSGTGSISQETVRDRVPVSSRPGGTIQDSQYNLSIPSRGIVSETSIPTDRRIISGQPAFEAPRIYGQDSASSQTQIQTGFEGTAAEASAAGHYGGLGSQTQVQGGYAGNGSFSAQAQSGFTGGVVQSQVQGGKKGGLSGSSAQVQRVGSAQSQVQVLQPSGSASSTAQGRFTGGTTQVQAQSSKTGGNAGAQAQSTGLSSSHAQVNIGGNDVRKDENFQGTVSASVHGGQSAGQSQTQLQGGYDSGRTYAATAQGGFDTALGLQVGGPPVGGQQIIGSTGSQESRGTFRGDQHQTSGVPVSKDTTHITQQALRPASHQTDDSRIYYPSSIQEPSKIPSSMYRETYPGHPTEVRDRRIFSEGLGDFPGYRRLDQSGVIVPSYQQQAHLGIQLPGTQDRTMHEAGPQRQAYPSLPAHTLTAATDQHYASRYPPSYPQAPGFYPPSQPSAALDSRYKPSISQYPGISEQSGVQDRYLPTSHFSEQSHILTPSSQIIPLHTRPGEMPVLTRPDGSLYSEPTHRHLPLPDLTKIQPEQPQFLFPSPQVQPGQILPPIQPQYPPIPLPGSQIQPGQPLSPMQPQYPPISLPASQIRPGQPLSPIQPQYPPISLPGSQIQPGQPLSPIQPQYPPISLSGSQIQPGKPLSPIQPQYPPISFPGSQIQPGQPLSPIQPQYPPISLPGQQIQPEQTPILQPLPRITAEQPQVSPPKPQISTTTERIPVAVPSEAREAKSDRVPGVLEPDKRDCCAALRDLKRRCCGGPSKQDKTSPCCRSSSDDIFDFSSDDDLDEDKEPCKVVKAICYIVYKPVGKARVCKPTAINGC